MCERCFKDCPVTHLIESELMRIQVCDECTEAALRLATTKPCLVGLITVRSLYENSPLF